MKNSVFNLSDDLVKSGIVSLKTLKRIEMLYMEDNTLTLERALIKEGVVTEEQIYDIMAKKMHLPLVAPPVIQKYGTQPYTLQKSSQFATTSVICFQVMDFNSLQPSPEKI